MGIVFFYAVLGGMKGITYTQVAQYCVLIFAYLVPAIFISILLTNNPVPQIGFGSELAGEIGSRIANGESITLLDKLDQLNEDLGFAKYTDGSRSKIDMFMIAMALMVGTAGLPHVIIRFYTVPKVRDARKSALWALFFIAILYTTAAAVGAFGRITLIDRGQGTAYAAPMGAEEVSEDGNGVGGGVGGADGGGDGVPEWFRKWEDVGLLAWVDKNGDGRIQYYKGAAFTGNNGKPAFAGEKDDPSARGVHGERLLRFGEGGNVLTDSSNELYIDKDIMVLANPEIAGLPDWVVGLVAAGGLAAALSTAAGLLLVVSTSISHDLLKRGIMPQITERGELIVARVAAGCAVCLAGYLGVHPPDYVAAVVAFAFGLAASSFFPVIIMGIFSTRMNKWGAIAGMTVGICFTTAYIVYFKFINPSANTPSNWWFGISPEGIGTLGMLLNFTVAIGVSWMTPPPPAEIRRMVHDIRLPGDAGEAHEVSA